MGDKAVVAHIKERQQATKEFEEAKAAGKSASLLEQERPNVFTMSVANVLPGDRVEVQLTYSEILIPEKGIYQFVYPTVVGPRYSNTRRRPLPQTASGSRVHTCTRIKFSCGFHHSRQSVGWSSARGTPLALTCDESGMGKPDGGACLARQ